MKGIVYEHWKIVHRFLLFVYRLWLENVHNPTSLSVQSGIGSDDTRRPILNDVSSSIILAFISAPTRLASQPCSITSKGIFSILIRILFENHIANWLLNLSLQHRYFSSFPTSKYVSNTLSSHTQALQEDFSGLGVFSRFRFLSYLLFVDIGKASC